MNEKKKILYIVEAMGGGIYTYMIDLVNELVKSFDMYIAYAIRSQTPIDYKLQFDSRVHLIEVKNFTRSINPLQDIKAFIEIKKIANDIQPDIIHLHSSKAGALGRWAFNGRKIPMFYTPHGYSFLMANYGCGKRTIFRMIEGVSSKRTCTTISCSEGEHLETLKLTHNAIYVDNGININELKTIMEKTHKSEEHYEVFTLGRICHQKNPELFNQIALKMPKSNFLWIGDGDLKGELNAPNITVTGWIKREEAIKLAMSADIFVLTSLWEGLPMSLLEAMYMKKMCVVSNVIGNNNVIHNGKNGYVCENVDEFVSRIENGCMEELISNAFEDVNKKYNTYTMSEKYKKIYLDVIENNK